MAIMVDSAEVLFTISTSGYLVLSSIATRISSPDGHGPQKSAATFSHGLLGVSVICSGDLCFCNIGAWHGRHLLHLASTFLSMFRNHTMLHRNCLFFMILKGPSWHISMTHTCNFGGITIWVTIMMISSTTLSSWNIILKGLRCGSLFRCCSFRLCMCCISRWKSSSSFVAVRISSKTSVCFSLISE